MSVSAIQPADVVALCIGVAVTVDARREAGLSDGLGSKPGEQGTWIQASAAGAPGVRLDQVTQRVLERFGTFEARGGDLNLVERASGPTGAVGCIRVDTGGTGGSVEGVVEHARKNAGFGASEKVEVAS